MAPIESERKAGSLNCGNPPPKATGFKADGAEQLSNCRGWGVRTGPMVLLMTRLPEAPAVVLVPTVGPKKIIGNRQPHLANVERN